MLLGVVLAAAVLSWQAAQRQYEPLPPLAVLGATSAPTTSAAAEPSTRPWSAPQFAELQSERDAMVRTQIAARDVTDPRVLQAMRAVPRHLFVSRDQQGYAHADRPLPIGYGQTISQPYIVALMTELLDLRSDSKVLEIGTGSGYQAAVLTELTPHVYTIEILKPLTDRATNTLRQLGYTTVRVHQADGYFGWPEHAPFDGIIVTCAAGHLPPPLFEQLKPGGRIVIPLGQPGSYQELQLVIKDPQTNLPHFRSICPVAFVPMTGQAQQRPR